MKKESWFAGIIVFFSGATLITRFSTFWSWPSTDVLPIIERYRNPQFLVNDLYTNIGSSFSVRTYFAWLINLLSKLFAIEPVLLFAYMIPIIAGIVALSFYVIARYFGLSQLLSVLAGVLPFALYSAQPALGLWTLGFQQAIPSALANMFIFLAISVALTQSSYLVILFLVFATLVHPTTGVLGSLLVMAALKLGVNSKLSWFHAMALSFGVSIIAATIFFLAPLHFSRNNQILNSDEFYHVYVQIRHPHHYDPAAWTSHSMISFLFYFAALVVSLITLKLQNMKDPFLKWGIVVACFVASMVLGHILFVNVFHTHAAVVFTPVRFAPLAWPFFLLLFLASLRNLANRSSSIFLAILLSCMFLFTLDAITLKNLFIASILICFGSLYTMTSLFPKKLDQRINSFVQKFWETSCKSIPAANVIEIIMLVLFGTWALLELNSYIQNVDRERTLLDQKDSAWFRCIQQMTPQTAQIIVHPAADSIAVRVKGNRAVFGDGVFPFNEKYVSEWWSQYRMVHDDTPIDEIGFRFDRLDSKALQNIANRSGAHFAIIDKKRSTFKALCKNSKFVLVSLDH